MFGAMLRRVAARLHEERGFTIVEAVVSITILALGGIAVTQSLVLGLRTSGASRERLAARSVVDQQMELARALNYDSLVLDDASPLPGSTDTDNPDYWVDEDATRPTTTTARAATPPSRSSAWQARRPRSTTSRPRSRRATRPSRSTCT